MERSDTKEKGDGLMIKDSLKALREYIYRHFNTYEGIKLNFKPNVYYRYIVRILRAKIYNNL